MEIWMTVIIIGGASTACLLGHWLAFSLIRKEGSPAER